MRARDWIVLVCIAGASPVYFVVRVELERWRDRRRARRRGGTIDIRRPR